MQLILNKWFAPVLAMFIVLAVSSLRVYQYLDSTLMAYANSFRTEDVDYYVYWTFHTRELQKLIDALENRQKEVADRGEELRLYEERLGAEKKELEVVRERLEALRKNIDEVVVQSRSAEMKNIKTLASTYSAMSADVVAGIFNQMDDNMVVKILALMKSDTVGAVFEAMTAQPGQEAQMRARIARLSEKMRFYQQSQK